MQTLGHKGAKRKPGKAEAMELGKTRASVDGVDGVGIFCELMAYERYLDPLGVERLSGWPARIGLVPKSVRKF